MKPWPLLLLLVGCAPDSETVPVASPPPTSSGQNVQYGSEPAQSLSLYPAERTGPLIVFVHGGAWQSGSRHAYDAVATSLQKKGIAVATVDYRLSPQVRHPAHAEDVAHALKWLAEKEKRPIVLVGHSAGAHIAMTLATTPALLKLASPVGFVGLEGIYDIPQLAKRWPSYPNWFLNKAFGSQPKDWPTPGKPASQAPWLLVHSKGDELVDQAQMDAFVAHLEAAGVSCKTLTPEGKTHDGVVQALANEGDEVTEAILAFAKVQAKP